MASVGNILSPSTVEQRILPSLDEVARVVEHLKGLGQRISLTSGSFDLIHLGHVKYLEKAKEQADMLFVGVDSDAKIRHRKGPDRPMVPEHERVQLLAFQRPVDFVYLKQEDDARWGLIRAVSPDVLVLTEDHSYSEQDLEELGAIVGRIEVIERQASVTTSERIRQMYMNLGDKLGPKLAEVLPGLIDGIARRG